MAWEDKEQGANGEWKLRQTEFYGYVKAKMDSLHEDVLELKENQLTLNTTVISITNKCAREQEIIKNLREEVKKETRSQATKAGAIVGTIITTVGAILIAVIQLF